MRVAVITVGDELLAGDTTNTNAAWLGRRLHERGTTVKRIIVVPDCVRDIAREVNQARADYDAVLVTGGLGPTHDDVTMEGVAAAVGRPIEEHPEAVEWFESHSTYSHSDLLNGTTDLPADARLLPNEEGVAPGAVVEADDEVPIYVLPGVPAEMKAMFDHIADEFTGPSTERVFIETSEPESGLLDRFETLKNRFDVAVGSYPGEDGVRIKIEGQDAESVRAAAAWVREHVD